MMNMLVTTGMAMHGAIFSAWWDDSPPRFILVLFVLSCFCIFYVYIGYPLVAHLLSRLRPRPVRKGDFEPPVTIVIAAYNEQDVIALTIENKLAQDYPRDKMEIIAVSDGSTDLTDKIVRCFSERNVRLLRQEPRAGKTAALNMAVREAKGEIIVFSDANSLYDPGALRRLLSNFADQEVGYVTGRMVYANPDGTPIGEGCGTYMKYENYLRSIETRLGSIVGVDGGIDAVRKALYRPMRSDQLPDLVQPLGIVEQGYRVVYEPEAVLLEPSLKAAGDEYRMRVRVSLRAFWAIFDMRKLLGSLKNPIFTWQLWSHKVMRYVCFMFLPVAYVTNGLLWNGGTVFRVAFILQNLCYLAGVLAPCLERRGTVLRVVTFSRYFLLLNIAAAHAFGKFLRGKKQALWTPRKG